MEHDPEINHSNSYLNSTESKNLRKYNRHQVLVNYSRWTEQKFGFFVKEHDQKMKDQKRKFGSVARFLKVDGSGKKRTLQPALTYIEKLSNEEDWKQFKSTLEKKLQSYKWTSGPKKGQHLTPSEARETALNTVSKGFEVYANGFNKRNPNLHMFEYYVHMDEEGAPHLHSQVMPFTDMGKTKKGNLKKPSWSLNTALARQYNSPRKNKENLSKFRQQEDQALIDSMNQTLEKTLGIKQAFQLVRKTDSDKTLQTGVDHEVYKARAKAIEQQEKQKQVNSKEIAKQTTKLKKLRSEQKGIETKQAKITNNLQLVASQLISKQKNLTLRENNLNSKETKLNARETALNARERNLTAFEQSTQQTLLQRETALKKREEDQKKKEEEQKQKRDKKLQEQYEKRKKDAEKRLKSWYKAKKGQYRTQATILKNLKQVYVGCVQTWIETVAPETKHQATTPVFNKPLDHSESWYMARGHYRSEFKPEDSQPSLYYVKSALDYRKPRERPTAILKGIKAVAKKFGSYLHDKNTLEAIKQLDSIDVPEAVKTVPEAKKQRRMKVYTKGSITVEKTHDQQQEQEKKLSKPLQDKEKDNFTGPDL